MFFTVKSISNALDPGFRRGDENPNRAISKFNNLRAYLSAYGGKPLHLDPTQGRGSAALYALPVTSILNATPYKSSLLPGAQRSVPLSLRSFPPREQLIPSYVQDEPRTMGSTAFHPSYTYTPLLTCVTGRMGAPRNAGPRGAGRNPSRLVLNAIWHQSFCSIAFSRSSSTSTRALSSENSFLRTISRLSDSFLSDA